MPTTSWPTVLTIAGSDSGGGAGIQADLKTFQALGCFGTSVIVAVTAQNTRGVTHVEPLSLASVSAQLDAVLSDFDVAAIKIGMLATAELVSLVAEKLAALQRPPPIVLDPVMVASTGGVLLSPDAVSALRQQLLPLATLCTPNLPEADLLAGMRTLTELAAQSGTTLLVTGGDATEPIVTDRLISPTGAQRLWQGPRTPLAHQNDGFHGTGCTLSSAIAAHLALGHALEPAIDLSITWVQALVRQAFHPGAGHSVLPHGLVR